MNRILTTTPPQGFTPYVFTLEDTLAATTLGQAQRVFVGGEDFLAYEICFRSTQQFKFSWRDVAQSEQFTPISINTRSLVGSGVWSFKLPVPWLFGAGTQIEMIAENLGGSGDTLRMTIKGVVVPQNMRGLLPQEILDRKFSPLFVMLYDVSIGNGVIASTTPNVSIGSRDFTWTGLGLFAVTEPFKFRVRDVNQLSLFEERTDYEALLGADGVPWIFTQELTLSRNSAIFAELENIGVGADIPFLTAIGYSLRNS
ncbi:hypothetical protein IH992_04055 [Candidatus Poribacteria bacterium]|nr:hypothetical protein [Candidatus Poribacteria bacterium]